MALISWWVFKKKFVKTNRVFKYFIWNAFMSHDETSGLRENGPSIIYAHYTISTDEITHAQSVFS